LIPQSRQCLRPERRAWFDHSSPRPERSRRA